MEAEKRKEAIRYWRKGAEEALTNAGFMLEKSSYSFALFLLHLAIEKMLKALVVAKTDDHSPRIHNLLYLAGKAGLELTKAQDNLLNELSRFNIEGRYPEEARAVSPLNSNQVSDYFKRTKEFYQWLLSEQKEEF